MIRIVKTIQNSAEVRRLKKRSKIDSYPRSYIELCQSLLRQGSVMRAMETAREGLERFPHSDDLRDVLRHTWRKAKGHRIDDLRKRCDDNGAQEDFVALATLYLECEEYDEALAVAEELLRRDEGSLEASALQADVLLRRFYKDHVASDARRAIVLFKLVLDANEENFGAHFELAHLYHYIGAISKALFHLYRALDIDPDHEEAAELHDVLVRLPLEDSEENSLLRKIEESEQAFPTASAEEAEQEATTPLRRAELIRDLTRLSHLNGVTRAAFVSSDLTLIARNGDCRTLAEGEEDALCELARGFRSAAAIGSKRMGIGAFQSSVLAAGRHTLQFHAVGHTVVLLESDDPSCADVIRSECMQFVASCSRNSGESVHA